VLGGELEPCGGDPLTGFYRDGCCRTGPDDRGSHTICAVVTAEFLEHQQRIGHDLITPVPEYRFPGLAPAAGARGRGGLWVPRTRSRRNVVLVRMRPPSRSRRSTEGRAVPTAGRLPRGTGASMPSAR
jgi:hypothetical protein